MLSLSHYKNLARKVRLMFLFSCEKQVIKGGASRPPGFRESVGSKASRHPIPPPLLHVPVLGRRWHHRCPHKGSFPGNSGEPFLPRSWLHRRPAMEPWIRRACSIAVITNLRSGTENGKWEKAGERPHPFPRLSEWCPLMPQDCHWVPEIMNNAKP